MSTRPGRELWSSDRQFNGGTEPSLLDIISINFLAPSPHPYQPENHTIDEKKYWSHVNRATFKEGLSALDPIRPDLWGTSFGSSSSGTNDRVPEANAPSFGYSLALIEVSDLKIHVSAEGASFGNMKRKLRGFFSYSQHNYALTITDPIIEAQYLAGSDGLFNVGRALLCVSLGELHQSAPDRPFYAYKLIAGIILP